MAARKKGFAFNALRLLSCALALSALVCVVFGLGSASSFRLLGAMLVLAACCEIWLLLLPHNRGRGIRAWWVRTSSAGVALVAGIAIAFAALTVQAEVPEGSSGYLADGWNRRQTPILDAGRHIKPNPLWDLKLVRHRSGPVTIQVTYAGSVLDVRYRIEDSALAEAARIDSETPLEPIVEERIIEQFTKHGVRVDNRGVVDDSAFRSAQTDLALGGIFLLELGGRMIGE